LPRVLAEGLGLAVDTFLASAGRARKDVRHHWIHPGGRRVLETYGEIFAVSADELHHSAESLRQHGNLSSASVLNVLERALGEENEEGDALVLGVGPGLSAEFLLLGAGA
ncbi:MAG: 3-oxoacyl-[acyl-carrier-protein] synthase III C-terminal domain-containing protein, partial [Planctomycetota bacterium]